MTVSINLCRVYGYMVQKFLNVDPKIFRLDKESLINEIELEKKSVELP